MGDELREWGASRAPRMARQHAADLGMRRSQVEPWPGWHCVTIEEIPGGWMVACVPHGLVSGLVPTHLDAFIAAVQHDYENGTWTA